MAQQAHKLWISSSGRIYEGLARAVSICMTPRKSGLPERADNAGYEKRGELTEAIQR